MKRLLPIMVLLVPATVRATEQTEPFSGGFRQSLSSVVIMLVVLLVAAWLLRRMAKTRISQSDGNSHIRLLSQKTLGMREKLVLVEVEGARILLGITQNNIQGLHCFGADSSGAGGTDRKSGKPEDQ